MAKVEIAKPEGKTLIPLGNRVLLRPEADEKRETKTPTGIILPSSTSAAREKEKTIGRIVRISPDLQNKSLVDGDLVIYSKFSFDKITVADEEFIVVDYENILAVLK